MKRIRTSTAAVALPSLSNTGTEGCFQDGNPGAGTPATKFDAAWCNGVQEEIVAVITDVGGAALSGSDLGQMATALKGARAIKATPVGSSDTGNVTTPASRAVIAALGCQAAGGGRNLAAASDGLGVTGLRSAAMASQKSGIGTAGPGDSAVNCAAVATDDALLGSGASCTNGLIGGADTCTAEGTDVAILGAKTSEITGASSECGMLGVEGCTLDDSAQCAAVGSSGATGANGINAVVAGTQDCTANGQNALVGGSEASGADGSSATTVGSYDAQTDGDKSVSAACHSTNIGGSRQCAMLVGSKNAELAHSFALAMGYHASVKPSFSDSDHNLTFRVDGTTGDVYADGSVGAGAADFAECFENETAGAIPAGALVARTGRKVRLAQPGDRVAGVVSAAPLVLGGDGPSWSGRYERDEFGARVMETHEHVRWSALYDVREVVEPATHEDGAVTEGRRIVRTRTREAFDGLLSELDGRTPPADAVRYTVDAPKPSAEYEPGRPYVSRRDRPEEWSVVALIGQVRVRVDASVAVGDLLEPGPGGVARASAKPKGRPVEVMEITVPFDASKGYAVALCLVG